MNDTVSLFDQRSVIGARLEQLLADREYTKTRFCREAGISRPTLDKLLGGTITSQTSFDKHIAKVLDCLGISPELLAGSTPYRCNRTRELRSAMHIDIGLVSQETGIPTKRLKAIEAGAAPTEAELRDIAFCLGTSTRSILGTNFFETQVSVPGILLPEDDETPADMAGFWGHIGILPASSDDYIWFPITGNTRQRIYESRGRRRMVIPCMNNKLLLLNLQKTDSILLLDDSCDPPDFAGWDPGVDCGGCPLAVYEALDDYAVCPESVPDSLISEKLQAVLAEFLQENGRTAEEAAALLEEIVIHFQNGKTIRTLGDFFIDNSLTDEIRSLYIFGEAAAGEAMVFFLDQNGTEILVNLDNVPLIELPLLKTEEAILEMTEADGE